MFASYSYRSYIDNGRDVWLHSCDKRDCLVALHSYMPLKAGRDCFGYFTQKVGSMRLCNVHNSLLMFFVPGHVQDFLRSRFFFCFFWGFCWTLVFLNDLKGLR